MRVDWIVEGVIAIMLLAGGIAPQSDAAQEGDSNVPQATRVTLRGEMSVAEAFDQIGKQVGLRIQAEEFRNRVKSFDFESLEFWKCLEQLAADNDALLFPYKFLDHDLWVVSIAKEIDRSQQYAINSGPFRAQVVRIAKTRSLVDAITNSMRVELVVFWEPHAHPVSIQIPLNHWSAVTDDGTEVKVSSPPSTLDSNVHGSSFSMLQVLRFQLPPQHATRIKTLKGPIHAVVPGKQAMFEFTDLVDPEQSREMKNGDVTVRLDGWSRNDEMFDVRLHVAYAEHHGALESFRDWITKNEMVLDDGMGTTYKPEGLQVTSSETGVHLTYQFAQNPESKSLVYHTANKIHLVVIEAEFRDLILP